MADIKFMDLSENDNPATTDSILIGNNDNGVKRTTLGKIGDMFAVHGLFQFRKTSVLLQVSMNHYSIQAPTIDGYQFVFWLSCIPENWGGTTYVEGPTNANTNIWITDFPVADANNNPNNAPVANNVNAVSAIAVYIKNSVA